MMDQTHIATRAYEIASALRGIEGPLLPILHELQTEFGYLPKVALPEVAKVLNLSRADVHGVASFYHDFKRAPGGAKTLKICRSEACQAMGGAQVAEELCRALQAGWHETSADGVVTIEPVYCLGLCSVAPAAMLDEQLIGRADAQAVLDAVAEA